MSKKVIFVSRNGKEYHKGDRLTLDGITFEVCKPCTTKDKVIYTRDIYECYERPSQTKIAIWNEWCRYFIDKRNCFRFGVASYNSMQFTIEAIMWVEELGCDCYLSITKTRNWLFPMLAHC